MEMSKRRSFGQIALGFFLLAHPGPVAFHIVAVTAFAVFAAWGHLVWGVIALVVAAHAAMQLSIAMLNDYADRRLDARGKPGKPLVRGLVTPGEALGAGIGMILLMLALLLWLNPLALVISLVYLALGQAYNFGVKATPWSGLVFSLAIALIPLYALAGVNRIAPASFWLVPVGFLVGMALNLANSLPDVESDQAGGARTLAVLLGVRGAFLCCPLLIALAVALAASLIALGIVQAQPWMALALLAVAVVAIGTMVSFFGPQKPLATRKGYFYLVASTSLILGLGWFILVTL
ncbi:MAG TPA: UbiA family prenyltransferase [Ktedonobacterales bacterium]|nr:UbiA family prenyltransferase [Ktedonobacterales bacterium]